ncbi:hypothetical protein ACWDA3_09640 [Nonomuraea rubra]
MTGIAAAAMTATMIQAIAGGAVTRCHDIGFRAVTPDDLWRQFGIGGRRARRFGLPVMAWMCAVSVAVAAFLWETGALYPRIDWSIFDFFMNADVDENGVLSSDLYIELENKGLATFTITAISMDIPGLRLLPADVTRNEDAIVTVGHDAGGTMRRRMVITDCAAVPHEPQPIRFTYRTWLGEWESEVIWDSWTLTNSMGKRVPVAWQRAFAVKVCDDAVADGSPA